VKVAIKILITNVIFDFQESALWRKNGPRTGKTLILLNVYFFEKTTMNFNLRFPDASTTAQKHVVLLGNFSN
jgi:hypothetical protein